MNPEQRELEDRRGLRFPFGADAEVVLEGSPESIPARATELSFRGCFLEISAALREQQRVHVKIFHADEYFEALAEVIYVRPGGAGLVFGNTEPHFRSVLQAWILSELDHQGKSKRL
jgi:PilZ domain